MGRSERSVVLIFLFLVMSGVGIYSMSHLSVSGAAPQLDPPAHARSVSTSAHGLSSTKGSSSAHRHSRDTIYTSPDYVGPPAGQRQSYTSKFVERRVLDLNRVDSSTLLRVPGIGPSYAHRILALRYRLGGFYTVLQLQEVYGMDEDHFLSLRPWFVIQTPPQTYPLATLRADSVPYHPYMTAQQRRVLNRLLHRYGRVSSWATLMREEAFAREDSIRLSHYFTASSSGRDEGIGSR